MRNISVTKRLAQGVLAIMLLASLSVATTPRAHAQWFVSDLGVIAKMTIEKLLSTAEEEIADALVASIGTQLMNVLATGVNQLAFNSAMWVASGGHADAPLIELMPPDEFFKQMGAKVVSDLYNEIVVENLDDGLWPTLNVYLPTDPIALESIRSGLRALVEPPEITFDYPEIRSNWAGYLATLSATDIAPEEKTAQVFAIMAQGFDPRVNEISAIAELQMYAMTEANRSATIQTDQHLANDGFRAVAHYITGQILTPASAVKGDLESSLNIQKNLPIDINLGLLQNTDSLIQIGLNGGSLFVNTLFSELFNKMQTGLFEDIVFDDSNPFDSDGSVSYSRERLEEKFSSIKSFKPIQVTDYNLLSELSSCPTTIRGSSPRLYNCAIDTSFASAIAMSQSGNGLTLQEAIDEGYIKGDWPLIPSSDTARNQDPKCYTYGFCHSNLVKMRKARLIPVGWEMATESSYNSDTDPVTLQEAINGFYSCNSDGELDAEHPWCHLVDPNWLLAFPPTQCRTMAYGQILQSSGTDQRAQECVDIQSCVSQDGQGDCDGGYGYCVRESNMWQFRGTQCPEHYASCLTFETPDGDEIDYLTNTLNYEDCTAGNAGCYWYATMKEPTDGVYDWPDIDDVLVADLDADAFKNRLYFNGEVTSCESTSAGCTELFEREDEVVFNVIANSSFETDDNEDGWPDGWVLTNSDAYSTDDSLSRFGDAAIDLSLGDVTRYGITLHQTRYYGFSLYVASETGTATAELAFMDEDGNPLTMTNQSMNESCSSDDCAITCAVGSSADTIEMQMTPASEEYVRMECVFTTPTLTDRSLDLYLTLSLSGNAAVDDVMIEQNADTSIYTAGYSQALDSVYLSVAPDYLGCSGASTDPDACAGYATVCSEQDAGCGEYTPVNGDPGVTAVVSLLDECPVACDGYDTYRQEATTYEPYGEFPLYFIPDTADECSQSDVGCTEFTNLSTEETEYYTYLRACVTSAQASANTNGDNEATFYTWEGSDEEGYQLRTWQLLQSDLDGAAYYNYAYQGSGEIDSRPGAAPCTHWSTDSDGITCNDDQDGDAVLDMDNEDCDEHYDIFRNPSCREFYDAQGGIHYREWDLTVTVHNDCDSYRITDLAGSDATEWEATCDEAQGYYDPAGEFCRFYGYDEESTSCRESKNGCRAFTGGRSGNSRLVLEDLFEDGSINNWEADNALRVTLSNESVAVGGHSLKSESEVVWSFLYDEGSECSDEDGCASTSGTLGGSCTVGYEDQYCGTISGELYANKTYTLTFWAKGAVDVEVGFDFEADTSAIAPDVSEIVELSSQWAYYSIGPFDLNENEYPELGDDTVLVFDPNGSGDFYIDNIVLREGEDQITLIKDSWETPQVCDQTWGGVDSAQHHLGCQEYTDQNEDTWYLKTFRNLCDGDAVGCTGYYDTQNSDSEYASVYNVTCYNIDADGDGQADEASARTTCYLLANTARTAFDSSSPALCTIATGDTSCRFDFEDWFVPPAMVSDLVNYPEFYHLSYGADAAWVDADMDAYYIYDENLECESSYAGCQEFGEPTFSRDESIVSSWESVYLLNDPDDYDDILCNHDSLFCNAFESNSEGTWYFKDPFSHTCEYKTDVNLNGTSYSGWFQNGTSEFCYGTGVCSGSSSVTCSTDSQCALAGLGECTITSGSYLIGGDKSGIWRNGDAEYDGWVGECSAEYDGCTSFEDPLDIDEDEFYTAAEGKTYFYIDNDRLSDDSLLSSQRCKGQVSLEEGCVLFYDNGDFDLDYNASATSVVSRHADEILGETIYSLVDPVDCTSGVTSSITLSDGSEFDPCASRCTYDKYKITGEGSRFSMGADSYIFGLSCFTDSDCPTYEGFQGDLVDGSCETSVITAYSTSSGTTISEDVPRLENDTNRIVRVNQGRVCSQWLSCASSYSIWDEDLGRYRTICDAIDLCTEYSSEGHPSFCSAWSSDNAAVALDVERYVARDISWYGQEYSGYSIPDMFPVQYLEQVDISPPAGTCDMSDFGVDALFEKARFHGEPCDSDVDCSLSSSESDLMEDSCVLDSEVEYRLGFVAGSCDGDHAEECTVGYCTDNGAACTDNNDCINIDAECVPGVCYAVSTTVCESTSDCASGEECLTGVCATQGDYCDLSDLSCGTGETCFTSSAYKTGSCYRGSCFLAMDGDPYDTAEYEGKVCRAHPEVDSPFGNNIVEDWIHVNQGDTTSISSTSTALTLTDVEGSDYGSILPKTFKSGFGQVNTCAPGEDCVCSYTTLESTVGQKAYVGVDFESSSTPGLCSSDSPVAGSVCFDDSDCVGTDSSASATCNTVTKENDVYGLEGFCLERDTGLNIEGDAYTGACLTWLPVDQLLGSTDLYAKYKGAGFFENVQACTYVQPYIDLRMTYAGTDTIACASNTTACTEKTSYDDMRDCAENVGCPDDYFAVLGQCEWHDSESNTTVGAYASACFDTSTWGKNDCPYVCVPENSYNSDGELCSSSDYVQSLGLIRCGKSDDGTQVYCWANQRGAETVSADDYLAYNNLIDENFADCIEHGILYDDDTYDKLYGDFPKSTDKPSHNRGCRDSDSGSDGYRCVSIDYDYYPGCEELIDASTPSESYAWTNRIYFGEPIATSESKLQYDYDTPSNVFGTSLYSPSTWEQKYPIAVATCAEVDLTDPLNPVTELVLPDQEDDFSSCTHDYEIDHLSGIDPALPDARSYVPFSFLPTKNFYLGSSPWSVTGTVTDAIGRITHAFAKIDMGNLYTWTTGNIGALSSYVEEEGGASKYSSYSSATSPYAISFGADVRGSEGTPPTVWSVDVDNCGSYYCEEGIENAITLNNKDSGDFESDEGFFRATIKFFAAAYKEQLPIRTVVVDWGDGRSLASPSETNYYKNHRGLVDGSQTESKCDTEAEWGMTADSCDPNYFTYQYAYRCADASDYEACQYGSDGLINNSPCAYDENTCAFRPRVHVRDNWGWCTGVCTLNTDDSDDGCYAGDAYGVTVVNISYSECAYQFYDDASRILRGADPWVYYDGMILVDED